MTDDGTGDDADDSLPRHDTEDPWLERFIEKQALAFVVLEQELRQRFEPELGTMNCDPEVRTSRFLSFLTMAHPQFKERITPDLCDKVLQNHPPEPVQNNANSSSWYVDRFAELFAAGAVALATFQGCQKIPEAQRFAPLAVRRVEDEKAAPVQPAIHNGR